jgi:hypothetical protein
VVCAPKQESAWRKLSKVKGQTLKQKSEIYDTKEAPRICYKCQKKCENVCKIKKGSYEPKRTAYQDWLIANKGKYSREELSAAWTAEKSQQEPKAEPEPEAPKAAEKGVSQVPLFGNARQKYEEDLKNEKDLVIEEEPEFEELDIKFDKDGNIERIKDDRWFTQIRGDYTYELEQLIDKENPTAADRKRMHELVKLQHQSVKERKEAK